MATARGSRGRCKDWVSASAVSTLGSQGMRQVGLASGRSLVSAVNMAAVMLGTC